MLRGGCWGAMVVVSVRLRRQISIARLSCSVWHSQALTQFGCEVPVNRARYVSATWTAATSSSQAIWSWLTRRAGWTWVPLSDVVRTACAAAVSKEWCLAPSGRSGSWSKWSRWSWMTNG